MEKLDRIYALINEYMDQAFSEEALNKFGEIVVAPNGYKSHKGITVMGYFAPIETESGYDFSMEKLGFSLKEIEGVKVIMECNLVYDKKSGRLVSM